MITSGEMVTKVFTLLFKHLFKQPNDHTLPPVGRSAFSHSILD